MPEKTLNETETLALSLLQEKEARIHAEYIAPLQQQHDTYRKGVEERLELDEGAIGTTHEIAQTDTGLVVRVVKK